MGVIACGSESNSKKKYFGDSLLETKTYCESGDYEKALNLERERKRLNLGIGEHYIMLTEALAEPKSCLSYCFSTE
jgi:hypothetical protein